MNLKAGKYGEYKIIPKTASFCLLESKNCLISTISQLWIESITINKNKEYRLKDKIDIRINPKNFKNPIDISEFNYSYIINKIYKLNNNVYQFSEFIENESKLFLTCILGKNSPYFEYKTKLCNTYIDTSYDQKYKGSKNVLYLLYKAVPLKSHFDFEAKLKTHPLFIDLFNDVNGDSRFSLFVFKIPEIYKLDIALLKLGRFKDFSNLFKNQIITFHNYTSKHLIFQVLNHSKELKELKMKQLGITNEEWYKKDTGGISPNDVSMRRKPNLKKEIL